MWGIETYKETGEFHEFFNGKKFPKHEAFFEPISDDLEIALEFFSKKYSDLERYHLGIAWRQQDNVKFFYVEEQIVERDENGRLIRSQTNMIATLKKAET